MLRKSGPHTGMSREPCDATTVSPEIVILIDPSGYFPPCRLVICVRSAGGTFIAFAAGPSPLPLSPWQTAQYALYDASPVTSAIGLMGSRLIVGVCAAAVETMAIRPAAAVSVRRVPFAMRPPHAAEIPAKRQQM